MFLFLFFSVLLLCSFFILKELFQVKNGVTTSLLVSMDVMSLDTNIQQNEDILKLSVTKHMKISTKTTHSYTLLAGNSQINPQGKFLPLQWKALPTKPWNCNGHKDSSFDSFANIFLTYIETTTLCKTVCRTTAWKCYILDIFSLWDISKPDIEAFIEQANLHHPTIKSTAETFDTEMQRFQTRLYTKAQDSRKYLSLMQRHILNKRKPSCTHISSRVTLQVLKKDLSKDKP